MVKRRRVLAVVAVLGLVPSAPAVAASWSSPIVLSASTPGVDDSRVAIDSAGYGVAVFDEAHALRVAQRVPGGAWQISSVPLSAGWRGYRFGVSIDPDGNALVVWDILTPTEQTILTSTWRPGAAAWTPATVIATTPSVVESEDYGAGVQFSASSNAAGKTVVSWQSSAWVPLVGYVTKIYATVGSPTSGLARPVEVSTLPADDMAFNMTTAMGSAGDAAIQWTREYAGTSSIDKKSDIEVAVGPAATGFGLGAPLLITNLSMPEFAEGGSVAVDGVGDVLSTFVASMRSDASPYTYRVESSFRPAAGAFGQPQIISGLSDILNTNHVTAAFDGHGNATAAWVGFVRPPDEPFNPSIHPPTLYSAERAAGSSAPWGPATHLADLVEGVPRIAEMDDGSAILSLDPGGSWDSDIRLTRSGSGAFGAPDALGCVASAIAIAPNGDAVMTCSGALDGSEQIATRYTDQPVPPQLPSPGTTAVAPTVVGPAVLPVSDAAIVHPAAGITRAVAVRKISFAVGLRFARVLHRRLQLRGIATGRGTASITIRRRARLRIVARIRVLLRGGAWTRSLTLPRGLAVGTYDVIAVGAHMRNTKTSFHLSNSS